MEKWIGGLMEKWIVGLLDDGLMENRLHSIDANVHNLAKSEF
jgi:hypothetical protein